MEKLGFAIWEEGVLGVLGVLDSYVLNNALRDRIGGGAGWDDDDAGDGAYNDYGVSRGLNTCGRFSSASCYL